MEEWKDHTLLCRLEDSILISTCNIFLTTTNLLRHKENPCHQPFTTATQKKKPSKLMQNNFNFKYLYLIMCKMYMFKIKHSSLKLTQFLLCYRKCLLQLAKTTLLKWYLQLNNMSKLFSLEKKGAFASIFSSADEVSLQWSKSSEFKTFFSKVKNLHPRG